MRRLLPVGLVLFAASMAMAQPTQQSQNCSLYVGLMNRIAGCIRESIDNGAYVFFDQFYPMVQGAITALMTLVIIIYGILLMYGLVEKIGRDTFILLIKVGAVVMFTANSPLIYQWTTQAMDGAAAAAVSYTPPSGVAENAGSDFSQNKCMQVMIEQQANAAGDGPMKPVIGPWLGMDCLLDTVLGIKVADKDTGAADPRGATEAYNKSLQGDGLARGLMFLFFSGMQSSVIGLIMAIIGFIFTAGLLMLIVKAFFTYIGAYIGIALLVIVSPLIIPLVLLRATKQYFDKWVRLMISFSLQPVIILVFISFSLAAMDFAVFSGNYSVVYRIAGEASRGENFSLNKYVTDNKIIVQKQATVATVTSTPPVDTEVAITGTDEGGALSGTKYSECTESLMKADPSVRAKCVDYPIRVMKQSVDWEKMAEAREAQGPPVQMSDGATNKGQQISREVLSSVLFCGIVVFILNGLLAVVPGLANDIMGDSMQTPDLGGDIGKIGVSGGGAGGLGSGIAGNFAARMRAITGGR